MLDHDDAGQAATDQIAKMIKAGKVFVAKLPDQSQHVPVSYTHLTLPTILLV